MRTILILLCISLATPVVGQVHHEEYELTGPNPNRSVATGTLSALRTEGIVAKKITTTRAWMRELAQQKLGKDGMRRLYLVMFSLSNGEKVQAVAELEESSMPEQSGLVVYVVSTILQPDGVPVPPRR